MAKKPTLRELQEVYFQDRTKFFAELSSSQQAFEAIMQRGSVKRAQMEKDMAAALAAVDQETQKEAEESKVRLSQLIPIDPNESPPPTLRAATKYRRRRPPASPLPSPRPKFPRSRRLPPKSPLPAPNRRLRKQAKRLPRKRARTMENRNNVELNQVKQNADVVELVDTLL